MDELSIINYVMDNENQKEISDLARAISSPERLKMLNIIYLHKNISIVEIAEIMDIAVSSASFHAKILANNNLIAITQVPGKHGTMRMCSPLTRKIGIELFPKRNDDNFNTFTYNIPIGSYTDVTAFPRPTCGLATETEIIEQADNPSSFFSPMKTEAQIIWMSHGEITYKIPNYFLEGNTAKEISFSCELCSEAPFYDINYKSDITLWINGHEIVTYQSPSDFGDRHGKLTPSWWNNNLTQYGKLVEFNVTEKGAYINNQLINKNVVIDDLNLNEQPFISFKLGVKDDAVNKGGFNLFGEKFGDYNQNIIIKIKCK